MSLKLFLLAMMALLCGLVLADEALDLPTGLGHPGVPVYEDNQVKPFTTTYSTTYTEVSFIFTGLPDTLTVYSTVPVTVTEVETRTFWPKGVAGRADRDYQDGVYDCTIPGSVDAPVATPSPEPVVLPPPGSSPSTTTPAALLPPHTSFQVTSLPTTTESTTATQQTTRTETTNVGNGSTTVSFVASGTHPSSSSSSSSSSEGVPTSSPVGTGTEPSAGTGTETSTGSQTPSAPPASGADKAGASVLGLVGAGALALAVAI